MRILRRDGTVEGAPDLGRSGILYKNLRLFAYHQFQHANALWLADKPADTPESSGRLTARPDAA